MAGTMRSRVIRRLEGYWKMEAGNVVFVPAVGAFLVLRFEDQLSWPVAVSMAACAAFLLIGAVAWRMELAALKGDRGFEAAALPWLARAQPPGAGLLIASVVGAVYEFGRDGRWTPSSIAASALAGLAVLEYVNYFHVQLQHFDHPADFQRLLRGRGFREAHLARALRKRRETTAGRGRRSGPNVRA